MITVVGKYEELSHPGVKTPRVFEAIQAAIENAPGPGPGTDIQTYSLVKLEIVFGGFVMSTTTIATIEVRDGAPAIDIVNS